MAVHICSREVALLNVFLDITGQNIAICPSICSSCAAFWAAVSRLDMGMVSESVTRPLYGFVLVFFSHEAGSWLP